jgi:hypothetical protein
MYQNGTAALPLECIVRVSECMGIVIKHHKGRHGYVGENPK